MSLTLTEFKFCSQREKWALIPTSSNLEFDYIITNFDNILFVSLVLFMTVVSSQLCHWLFIPYLHPTYKVHCKYMRYHFLYHLLKNLYHLPITDKNSIPFQGRRNRKLFWLPAIAPLISVILSTIIVYLTKAEDHGVKIVKHIKGGLNPSSIHQLQFSGPHVGEAAKIGLICAIVALTVRPLFSHSRVYNLKKEKGKLCCQSSFGFCGSKCCIECLYITFSK